MKSNPFVRICFALLIVGWFPFALNAQSDLTPRQWLDDLNRLEQLLTEEHVRPFWISSEEEFKVHFDQARQKFTQSDLSEQERIFTFMKLLALTRDGHSNIRSKYRYGRLGYLPFTAKWFEDGLYIIETIQPFGFTLGAKIIAVNDMPISEVCNQLKTIVPHANESRFKKFSPYYLHLPGALFGLDITDSPESSVLLLEDENGAKFNVEFQNLPPEKEENAVFVSLKDQITDLPLYQQNDKKAYWFEYLPDQKVLYLKYNRVTSMEEENIWAFAGRLFSFVDNNDIEKFIVDIRDNGGGSSAYSASLWHGIKENQKINQAGKLFVITGYNTFSAAIGFASYLERYTAAIFVGEPPCDHLHSPGDDDDFLLPNSKLEVALSQIFHEGSFYKDSRKALYPDFQIGTTFSDFSSGSDPIMEFILGYSSDQKRKPIRKAEKFKGRFAFSPDTRLEITEDEGGLSMEITGKMQSPLYPIKKRAFATEIKGLELYFDKLNRLIVKYPDGRVRILSRTDDEDVTPLEFIYNNQFDKAEQLLLQLKLQHPEDGFWKDHTLSNLALEVYYDLKETHGREKAKAAARAILEIAIRINPENHDFAKASLQYY